MNDEQSRLLLCFDSPLQKGAGIILIPVTGFLMSHAPVCVQGVEKGVFACYPTAPHLPHIETPSTGNAPVASSASAQFTVVASLSASDALTLPVSARLS